MITMHLSEAAERIGARHVDEEIRFSGCSIDSRTVAPGNLFIALHGKQFDGHDFISAAREKGAVAALVDRDSDYDGLPVLRVNDTGNAMALLAAYWRDRFEIPFVAVTGSNGKTTVKEMLRSILGRDAPVLATDGNLNNEIGVPLTLFRMGDEHRHAVIEMGANHSGEIARLCEMVRPDVAVITQCAPAHLEGFGSVEGVARAKSEIYAGLQPDGTAVINADDTYAGFWRDVAAGLKQISFGIENEAEVTASAIEIDPGRAQTGFELHCAAGVSRIELPLAGRHNVMNALAAAACCLAIDVPLGTIRAGLEKMQPVRGRLQIAFAPQGARLIDDTYNANPASLAAGLQVLSAYPGRRWLVLGDMGELGNYAERMHREAGESARAQGIERLYAIGELSRHAVEGFGAGASHYRTIDELLKALQRELGSDVTLLIKGSRFMAMDRVVKSLMEGN